MRSATRKLPRTLLPCRRIRAKRASANAVNDLRVGHGHTRLQSRVVPQFWSVKAQARFFGRQARTPPQRRVRQRPPKSQLRSVDVVRRRGRRVGRWRRRSCFTSARSHRAGRTAGRTRHSRCARATIRTEGGNWLPSRDPVQDDVAKPVAWRRVGRLASCGPLYSSGRRPHQLRRESDP